MTKEKTREVIEYLKYNLDISLASTLEINDGGERMSREEHYFENLIYNGSDECAGNTNRDTIQEEIRETIEMCYEYIIRNVFHGREELEMYLKESEDEE